jgi:pyrophosphatase PpaX
VIRHFFSAIVAGNEVQHYKPHPEPLEKGLALLGGDKASAIMIGDTDKDIGAANNLGIDSILFYPKEHEKFYDLVELKKHNPTHVVENFKEVLDLV